MQGAGAIAAGLGLFSLGIAVFFAGLAVMRTGVAGFASAAVRRVLSRLTSGAASAAATGLVLTLGLQSSSLVTVVLMEFVDAGLIPYRAAVAVILGGNVGAALTVQFLALKLYDLALPVMAVGLGACAVLRHPRLHAAAIAVFGFGAMYGGIALVTAAASPLTHDATLSHLLLAIGRSPLAAALFGCILTAVVQSNGIANGILLALGRQGLLPLRTAAAVIAGANVGSGALALIAALPASRLSRHLAVANALVNVAGLVWVVPAFDLFVRLSGATTHDAAQALANAHILFNLLASLSLLPIVPAFATFSGWMADRTFAAPSAPEVLPWQGGGAIGPGL